MTVPVLMPHQRDHNELVKKSSHVIDLYMLREAIYNIPVDYKFNQISLQMQEGSKNPWYETCGRITENEDKFNLIIPELKGTYIEEMLQLLPFKPIRARLLDMSYRSCYSIHRDPCPRYHIAVITNSFARFIFVEKERIFHIPADSYLYWTDTREEHTAINGTLNEKENRLHLVMGYS